MKGKGKVTTYWLQGENKPPPGSLSMDAINGAEIGSENNNSNPATNRLEMMAANYDQQQLKRERNLEEKIDIPNSILEPPPNSRQESNNVKSRHSNNISFVQPESVA